MCAGYRSQSIQLLFGASLVLPLGGSSASYSVVGIGAMLGNGYQDVLFRNGTNGDTGFYVIASNGSLSSWVGIGTTSLANSIAGIGAFFSNGTQ